MKKLNNAMVILYANQPVIKKNGRYFTPVKNFVDFLGFLAFQSEKYLLVVPVRSDDNFDCADYSEVSLPKNVFQVPYYAGHFDALLKSLFIAYKIRRLIIKEKKNKRKIVLAGPGPNSVLFWISWIVPCKIHLVFFIRGDTRETVRWMYKKNFFGILPVALVRLFENRIFELLRQKRATVFTFGESLKKKYKIHGDRVYTFAPLIEDGLISDTKRNPLSEVRPLKILYIGRFSEEKGVESLIDSCALACKRKNPFYISIIGHGHLHKTFVERIRTKNLDNWVQVVGHVPFGQKLIDYYDSHDLLCLPSRTEGVPRVVAEAFARGMPVMATRVGSLPLLFPDEICFIDQVSPEAIYKSYLWCRKNLVLFSKMGQKGQKRLSHFLFQNNAETVRKVIGSL